MAANRSNRNLWLWQLPALLILLTIAATGAFYETNDDLVISFLLRGQTTGAPVTDLLYFFYGIGPVIAWLYKLAPALPWYGLLLYSLLFLATVQAAFFLFKVDDEKQNSLPRILIPLAVLFISAWLEHIMWFSFVRVSVLLAGVSVLLFAVEFGRQHRKKWPLLLCILAFLVALCLRPKGAFLGAGLALPALWWLVPNQSVKKMLTIAAPFAVMAVIFQGVLTFSVDSDEKELRYLNRQKSNINDYQLLAGGTKNDADSLALVAVQNWLLADTDVLNREFYNRVSGKNSSFFPANATQKARQILETFARDYFLAILLQMLLVMGLFSKKSSLSSRTVFVLWQTGFWLLLLCIGIWLKLPARIATSAISIHLLALTGIWLLYYRGRLLSNKLPGLALAIFCLLQVYKHGHRSFLQRDAQQRNEQFLIAFASALPQYNTVLTANMGEMLSSLSPFRNYNLGARHVVSITGWPSLLPYYQSYLYQLSGKKPMLRLSKRQAIQTKPFGCCLPGFRIF